MGHEIWIIPFFGQGHLLPTIELCKHLASRNSNITLVIPSNLSSSIPSSLRHYPLLKIAELPSSPPSPPPRQTHHNPEQHHSQLAQELRILISTRDSSPPVFAIVDVMMGWTNQIFNEFGIPTIGFFTSGACSAAMEYAVWKAQVKELKPGEIRLFLGLPEEMALTDSDLKTEPHGHGPPPPPPGGRGDPPGLPSGMGLPGPPNNSGHPPPWLEEAKGCIGYLINTCDDLEHTFLVYIANQVRKPVWAVGPLLPEPYWKSTGSFVHDSEFRTNQRSNVTEEKVVTWLDSKANGSVLYVSFGSEVSPSTNEFHQLAEALEASNRPFIWGIQLNSGRPGPLQSSNQLEINPSYYPHGLDQRVGERGLIIHGWAPQLLILSHPSTGGFLSHCGWNSTVEAIGRGIPILAWPIRGDQYYNAKLVVKHLKVGLMIPKNVNDPSNMIKKDGLVDGIEGLLEINDEIKENAMMFRAKFDHGFPLTSVNALDAFAKFINENVSV